MTKEEDEEVKPSSSDAIIASLINEVRRTNEPFDMKSLISGKFEVGAKRETESDGNFSSLYGNNKKPKRHKDKKFKKTKKSKYKVRQRSKSPSRKKKKHRSLSRSTSPDRKTCHENTEKFITYTLPPSVEAVMEKISDDEDDLPVGADFLSVNASSSKIDGKSTLFQDISTTAQNKTKEFNVNEEVFPLAKKKKKSESPPILRKPRPLSEILAKVRAERENTFVPRNIKLKQENGKSFGGSTTNVISHAASKNDDGRHDDVEYGPRPLEALGTQPISDDEDELQLSPLKIKQTKSSKFIKIATISKVPFGNEKKGQVGKDREIPVNGASSGPHFSNDDTTDELIAEKHSKSERGISENENETRRKTDERKRKKERKTKKYEKRYSKRDSSLSSDSEREWKLLEKKNKVKEHLRYSGREFDKIRRRPGNLFVQSYYVDSNKRVHEGSKWQWNRGEKDVKEKINTLSTYTRSKGWKQIRSTKSPYPERRRKRSPSSSYSRSHSRTRSLSVTSSRSSHSPHYRKVRSSYRGHNHHHYYRDRENKRRSDDESNRHKIDKKKLLEIAQRNAAQMAQLGYLPNASVETKAQLKAGGQSVDQLVDFCQKLQRSQDKAARREKGEAVSSDEDLAPRKKKSEDDTDFLKHPFALKPATPITINIPNSIPLPVKTPAQRTLEESQLRIAYPVSSGAQHREKDNEWTPVKHDKVPTVCSPAQKEKLAPIPLYKEKEKVFNTFEITSAESFVLPPPPTPPILASFTQSASSLLNLPPPPPPPDLFSISCDSSQNQQQKSSSLVPSYGNVITVPEEESVFREPESLYHTPANVGRVMAKRIKASKLLAKDPNDYEARHLLKEADDQIRAWAESKKNLPGKFTGSTGVNVLKADQLGPDDPRFNVWAKKDFLKQTNAINSGVGLKLMQKMGWTPGEGLGKGRDGPLEPLVLDIKSDRKGLVATEELSESKKLHPNSEKNVAGKHPVSILMELCSKKRWHVPQFTCLESGPSNNRRFLWKAVVNGVEYQPSTPSTNKKTGKAQACQVVLQSLGLVPRDPSLPIVL